MTARASGLQEPCRREARDDESTAWVRALGGTGPERDEAKSVPAKAKARFRAWGSHDLFTAPGLLAFPLS